MLSGCPGAGNIKGAPSIKVKICPECGGEIELFSSDADGSCRSCGFIAYNDTPSCVSWCRYAVQCVGAEMYERLMKEKNAGLPPESGESRSAPHVSP
jgi:hypothetical protein